MVNSDERKEETESRKAKEKLVTNKTDLDTKQPESRSRNEEDQGEEEEE